MSEEQTDRLQAVSGAKYERDQDFASLYANNIVLEPSVWDLKLIFGQLEQHTGSPVISQHTAVAIPWIQAKLLEFYLRLFIAYQEKGQGPIKIPAALIPSIVPPTEEQIKTDPATSSIFETYKKLHADMFGK
jgi:hypothetical protein